MRWNLTDTFFSIALVVVMIVLVLFATTAFAAPTQCAPLPRMLGQLQAKYSERALFEDVGNDGVKIIIAANPAGTTWTALVVDDQSTACIVALGPGWVPGSEHLNPAVGVSP